VRCKMKIVRNIDVSNHGEIHIDGMLFCNKPEYVEYLDSFQAILCEICGYSGCELGNYVSLIKSKELIYLTIQFNNSFYILISDDHIVKIYTSRQ
jgi:hypothetical protein